MTVIESIVQGVRNLPLREQVKVARLVNSLDSEKQQERAAALQRTFGTLNELDGEAFQNALDGARRVETNG